MFAIEISPNHDHEEYGDSRDWYQGYRVRAGRGIAHFVSETGDYVTENWRNEDVYATGNYGLRTRRQYRCWKCDDYGLFTVPCPVCGHAATPTPPALPRSDR